MPMALRMFNYAVFLLDPIAADVMQSNQHIHPCFGRGGGVGGGGGGGGDGLEIILI